MHDYMDTGTPSTGGQRAADTWATNPLNPHRIRDSRLAAEAELFRELEEQAGADAELRSAFRAAYLRALAAAHETYAAAMRSL